MFRPDLTPAQHVARREALVQLARSADLGRGTQTIDEDILQPIGKQFLASGRRLDGGDFARTVSRIRDILSGYGPAILQEHNRPPTRAKPKGEEHEFTTLSRAIGDREIGQSGYEIVGIQMSVSRRRLTYSMEGTGSFITRHMMERSIERGMASWTGKLAEVEDAVLDTLGLAAVWRRALETGVTTDRRIALPCKSGLIYGIMERQSQMRTAATLSISGSRNDYVHGDPNPLMAHPSIAATSSTDVIMRTAIDDDSLTLGQCDLRDDLARFCAENEAILSEVRKGSLWRRSVLSPPRPYAEIAPEVDALAHRLVRLLSTPDNQEALRGRKPRDNGSGYEDAGTGADSTPKPW